MRALYVGFFSATLLSVCSIVGLYVDFIQIARIMLIFLGFGLIIYFSFFCGGPRKIQRPLTEEQIYEAIKGINSLRAIEVARAVEAAHGIK